MEDYHFHCFHASRETEPFPKAGLPGHASSDTLTLMSAPQDNRNTTDERDHHFLDACFRCGRLLGRNKDIFMYRGDTPFCSEECRQQEIDADEARERRTKQQPAAAPAAKRGRKQQRHMHVCLPPHMHVATAAAAPRVRRTNRPPHNWQAVASKMNWSVRRLPNLRRVAAWPRGCLADASCHTLQSGELRRAVDTSQTLVSLDP